MMSSEQNVEQPRRRKVTTALSIIVLLIVLYWALRAFERVNLYIPSRTLDAKPSDIGLTYTDVSLTAEDGVKIHAWFIPSENASATLLFCHGNAGNISHRLESIRLFHELGLNVLIFDYRGYGRSNGRPSEEGTYMDTRAAFDYAKTTSDQVVIFGRSLGGAVAVDLASKVDDAAALIVESSFTSTIAVGKEVYPFLPVSWIVTMQYDSLSKIPRVVCPVLVIHSPEDDIIPYHHGQALFEAASEPKMFLEITGGHNGGFIDSGEVYTDGIRRFLVEAGLKGDPS